MNHLDKFINKVTCGECLSPMPKFKQRQKDALILALLSALNAKEDWCGERQLQKAVYLLQDSAGVPLEIEFISYKHHQHSFDLQDRITAFRADELLRVRVKYPFGPIFVVTQSGYRLMERWPQTINTYEYSINSIVKKMQQGEVCQNSITS